MPSDGHVFHSILKAIICAVDYKHYRGTRAASGPHLYIPGTTTLGDLRRIQRLFYIPAAHATTYHCARLPTTPHRWRRTRAEVGWVGDLLLQRWAWVQNRLPRRTHRALRANA